MDQGRPYFEMDFSDENLTDKTFDAGIDEFICTMLSKHFKEATLSVIDRGSHQAAMGIAGRYFYCYLLFPAFVSGTGIRG